MTQVHQRRGSELGFCDRHSLVNCGLHRWAQPDAQVPQTHLLVWCVPAHSNTLYQAVARYCELHALQVVSWSCACCNGGVESK